MRLIYYNEVGQHEGDRQMTQPSNTIYKQRRCEECECNLLIQQISDDKNTVKTQSKSTTWFCHDCQDTVETKLVVVDWRVKESKSTSVDRLEKRCERRMQIITEMRDATEARLLGL
tara:strand:+ start:2194 stop:2541 length:348 start_codon:yes stop_codon:yes gene_type:complete